MTADSASLPPWWRVLLAFAVAPAVAALAFSCVSPAYEGLPNIFDRIWRTFPLAALVGGYLPAILIGLPAYAILRRRLRPTLLNCTGVAASVAGLPWILLSVLPAADSASINGHATVVNHHVTWFGVWTGLEMAAMAGAFGATAGLVFWLIACAGRAKRYPRRRLANEPDR
jgi:hypothetical protein